MRTIFAAIALIAAASSSAAQGNSVPGGHASAAAPVPAYDTAAPAAPLSALAQQAFNTCPALIARTESAAAGGHTQYYYQSDCECMARSIDFNTWSDVTAAFDGPKMPDSDAYAIVGALASSATIEDAFAAIDSNVSETGYSTVSACYDK